jgi:hypothetical protein
MFMRLASIALLLGTLALGACDDDDLNLIVPFPVTGTFLLQSANGSPLPATIETTASPPLQVLVLSGSIVINSNGTFSNTGSFRQTLSGVVSTFTVNCTGTFSVSGNTITFVEAASSANCGDTFTGTQNGNTLTTTLNGVPAIYIR